MKRKRNSNVKRRVRTDRIFFVGFLIIFMVCFLPFALKKKPALNETEKADPAAVQTDAPFTVADKPGIRLRYSRTPLQGIDYTVIRSDAAVLYDMTSGEVLFSKNPQKHLYPASMTKVLTACVALRYLEPSDELTVGSELDMLQPESSLAYLVKDTKITLEDALYGLLLPSGNDAAYTIAVNTARKVSNNPNMPNIDAVKYFAALMNDEALDAGAENSHFVVPDGYYDPDHYTTPEDMLKIAIRSAKYPLIAEIGAHAEYEAATSTGQSYSWENGNALVNPEDEFFLPFVNGLKTGFFDEAGYCMVATASENDHDLISVIMKAPSAEVRYNDVSKLFWSVIDPGHSLKPEVTAEPEVTEAVQ
ncbi:D-alanyl-D-alanine carboxypeptidase [Ruminococcus sp. HUN007]|uniref:D-alanyl-D-alanine carboxypeptidase family protein n=1 Tax=Ruminococcus sp. HUN007 TaxID=1514668 RepID=UPI000678C3CE|nr:D-alanyl-D-alanine carboxypeptidase [Ruminococcus sp. HUN007]